MSKRTSNKKGTRVRPARSGVHYGWRKRQLLAEMQEARIKAAIEGQKTGEFCEVQA